MTKHDSYTISCRMSKAILDFLHEINPSEESNLYAYPDSHLVDEINDIIDSAEPDIRYSRTIITRNAFLYDDEYTQSTAIHSTTIIADKDAILICLTNEVAICVYRDGGTNPFDYAVELYPDPSEREDFATEFIVCAEWAALSYNGVIDGKYHGEDMSLSDDQIAYCNQALKLIADSPESVEPCRLFSEIGSVEDFFNAGCDDCGDDMIVFRQVDGVSGVPGFSYTTWKEYNDDEYTLEIGLTPVSIENDVKLYSYEAVRSIVYYLAMLYKHEAKNLSAVYVTPEARLLAISLVNINNQRLDMNDEFCRYCEEMYRFSCTRED